MTDTSTTVTPDQPAERRPLKLRLPGFVREQDIGLGDAFRKATYAMGIRPCGGCDSRTAALNRWVRFTR